MDLDRVTIPRKEYQDLLQSKLEPVSSDDSVTGAATELAHLREVFLDNDLYKDTLNNQTEFKEKRRILDITKAVDQIYKLHFSPNATETLSIDFELVLSSLQAHFTELLKMNFDFYEYVVPLIFNPDYRYPLETLREIHELRLEFEQLQKAFYQAYGDFIAKYSNDEGYAKTSFDDEERTNEERTNDERTSIDSEPKGSGPSGSGRVDTKISELNKRIEQIKIVFCNLISLLPKIKSEFSNLPVYKKYYNGECQEVLLQQRLRYQALPWYQKIKIGVNKLIDQIKSGGSWILNTSRKVFTRKFFFVSIKHFYKNALIYYTLYSVIYQTYDNWAQLSQHAPATGAFLIELAYIGCKTMGNPVILGRIVAGLTNMLIRTFSFTFLTKRFAGKVSSLIGNAFIFLVPIYVTLPLKDLSYTILTATCEALRLGLKTSQAIAAQASSRLESIQTFFVETKKFYEIVRAKGFQAAFNYAGSVLRENVAQKFVGFMRDTSHGVIKSVSEGYDRMTDLAKSVATLPQSGARWTYSFIFDKFGRIKELLTPNESIKKVVEMCPRPGFGLQCGISEEDYFIWEETQKIELQITHGSFRVLIERVLGLIASLGSRIKNTAEQVITSISEVTLDKIKQGREIIVSISDDYIKPVWNRMVDYGIALKSIFDYYYRQVYALLGLTNYFLAVREDWKKIEIGSKSSLLLKIKKQEKALAQQSKLLQEYKLKSKGLYGYYAVESRFRGLRRAQIEQLRRRLPSRVTIERE